MSSTRRPFGRGPLDGAGASDGRDAAVVDFLRRTYAAPGDDDYWARLEQRVMAGVRGAEAIATPEWWQPFAGWVRMGLAAAGIAVLVAGAALMQSRAAEGSAAYAAVLDTPAAAPATQASAAGEARFRTPAGSLGNPQAERRIELDAEAARAREATLRFVISH